ncbi:MAG: hypothetical protein IPJ19_10035 [Planctomycetes bacterium]|nr:hypothetical protein [Planctomycetota bacterium]
MKPLPIFLVALLACGAGAVGGWFAFRISQSPSASSSDSALQVDLKPQTALPSKPSGSEAELSAKVESLERALDALHQDVTELRAGNSRTSAAEPEKVAEDQNAVAFATLHKSAILSVIEQDREEQARKAEEERRQRDLQQTQQRAQRTAQKVGLDAGQTKQLEGFYESQRLRMEELRTGMQNGTGDPQAMRQSFQDLRTWSDSELTNLFGSDLAAKIQEEGGFGARGGFGGPGGGGNNNGGGRRGRAGGGPGGGNNAGGQQGNGGQPGGG